MRQKQNTIKYIAKITISVALVGWVYGFFAVIPQTKVEVAQAATLSTLRPTGDGTNGGNFNSTGAAFWTEIDDDPDSGQPGADYVFDGANVSTHAFFDITNMPADFDSMATLEIKVYVTPVGWDDDTEILHAQLFQSNESTTLSNEVQVSTQAQTGLRTITITGITASNKTVWDGAKLRLRWVYSQSMGKDGGSIRVHAAELNGTYNAVAATTTLGDGTDPGNSTIGPGGSVTDIDQFTFTTNFNGDTITALTVTLSPAGSFNNLGLVEITNTSNVDQCTDISNPASVTLNFTGCSLAADVTGEIYKIRITPKSHAAMPAVPGASYATTAIVSNWTGTNTTHAGSDTDSATITVDNLSPGNVSSATVTPGDSQNDLAWTNPGDADFSEVIVLERASTAVGDTPVEGTQYSVSNTIGSSTVVCVTSSTSCSSTNLANGTAYHYKIFAKDSRGNYSQTGVVPTGSPATPVGTTTLGDGTDPSNSTIGPGGSVTDIDEFTFNTSINGDTITALTVTLGPASSFNNLALVEITNTSNVDQCTDISNPSSITLNFTGCSLTISTSPTTYKIRITPKSHAAMPAVPGASYATTAIVTDWTGNNNHAGSDTDSATITVDNLSPANVTGASVTPGDTQNSLAWTNPGDADFSEVIVLRHTSAVSDTPVEGATYIVTNTIGSSTVVCVTASTSCSDTGLTNGVAYHYKIFAKDSRGNYSETGVVPTGSPATPAVGGITISGTSDQTSGSVRVAVDGSLSGQTGSILGDNTWSITGVTVNSGEVIVVWIDAAAVEVESTAVAKYDGSDDMTGIVLNANVLSIGSVDDQTLSFTDLATFDCTDDEDIMYSVSAGTLAVDGCSNGYSDETLQIEAADTLVVGSSETLSSDNVNIIGNLTQTTTGVITLSGNISTSGGFNGGSGTITVTGNYTQTAGTFTSTSGTLNVYGSWTHTAGGTFAHNSGTVQAGDGTNGNTTWNVATTETFNNFTVNNAGGFATTVSSGDTLVVLGTYTQTQGNVNTGTIEARGNVVIGASSGGGADLGGTGTLSFLVAGDQTITSSGGQTMALNVGKSSGTVSVTGNLSLGGGFTLSSGTFTSTSDTLTVVGAWTHTAGGTFNHNSGTVVLGVAASGTRTIDVSTSETFNNLSTISAAGFDTTISSGDTLIVLGTLTQGQGRVQTGTLEVRGNVVIDSAAQGGSAALTFTGASAQTITASATLPTGLVTINKTGAGDTVTLASNVTLGGALTITQGTFSQGASFNLTTAGTLTVGANGTWTNTGTGNVTLGGDVSNAGTITLDTGGSQCGDADSIVLTSSAAAARTWSGAGTFNLYDLTVSWMSHATELVVFDSTNGGNNTNITFSACATLITISGTTNAGDSITVAVAVNGSLAGQTGTTGSGTWSISSVAVNSGEVITVFFSDVADSAESTAVAKYDGSDDMTGLVLNTRVLSIGSVDDQTLTVANLDLYDCNADEDVMYEASATTLDVEGCANDYSDEETIQIESGDTLVIDSDETLTSDNLTISGTLTQTTTGVITLTGDLTSSGTFNGGSGTITVTGNYTQTAGTFTSTSGTLALRGNWTHTAGGTFAHNSGTVVSTESTHATWDFATSETFNNFTLNKNDLFILTISSGDTLIVLGTFDHNDGRFDTGNIEVRGNVTVGVDADGGHGTLDFLVTGDQTITANGGARGTASLNINKDSGTVSVTGDLIINNFTLASSGTGAFTSTSGILTVGSEWTHTGGGTFNHNNGTVVASHLNSATCSSPNCFWDFATSETFYNFTASTVGGWHVVIQSGDTAIILNDFQTASNAIFDGAAEIRGNVTIGATASGGNAALTLTGSASQTITNNGGTAPTGLVTINKTGAGDTVTLASNVTLGGALTITQGTFSQGASFNLTTAGTLTVGANGTWTNTGTGNVTLGGNVSNSGTITLDTAGGECGDADSIVLTSTTTTARTWSGAGTFNLYDLTVSWMSHATELVVFDSTNAGNNTNITFSACGTLISISGRVFTNEGSTGLDCTSARTVRVKVDGAGDYSASCSNTPSNGSYTISDVDAASGTVLTIFLDNASENAVTVTRSSGSNLTGIDLYQNFVIMRSEDALPLTIVDMANYDSDEEVDGDIFFDAEDTTTDTLVVTTGTLYVMGSGSVAPGGNVTVTGSFKQVAGTFNGGSGTYDITDSFTLTGGSYTSTSGTFFIEDSFTVSGAPTFDANGGIFTFDSNFGATTMACNSVTFNQVNLSKTHPGGTISIGSDCAIPLGNSPTSSGTITNNGDITIGTGTWTINWDYTQNAGGSVTTSGGTIDVNNGGALTLNGGDFTGVTDIFVEGNMNNTGNVIDNGTNITFDGGTSDSTITCGTVTWGLVVFNKGNPAGESIVGADCVMPLGNSVTTAGSITNNGTLNIGTGTWTINGGNYVQNSGSVLTMTGTTIDINGVSGFTLNGGTFPAGITTITTEVGVNNNGNLLPDGIALTLDNSTPAASLHCGDAVFGTLTFNKNHPTFGPITILSNCSVTGDFNRTAGTVNNPASPFTISVQGNVTFNAVTTDVFGGSNLTLELTGTNAQSITHTAGTIDSEIVINKASNTASLASNLTTGDDVTVTSGTFSTAGFDITGDAANTFSVANGATFNMTGDSAYPASFATYTYGATSTVGYLQNATTTITNATYGHLDLEPSATVTFTLPATLNSIAGNLSIGDGTNSGTITGATNNPSITVAGSMTINANATFTSTSGNLTIGTNLTNNGTFTHNSGTVVLNTTTTAVVEGPITFNNLTAATSGKTVEFTATQTFTVNGLLTLTDVTVTSTTGSSQWIINHQGTESVTNVTLSWSGCDGSSTDITITSGTNSGNNGACWVFPAAGITISGTTNAGDGLTVAVVVNGSLAGQTGSTGSSAWSITDVSVSSGQVIVVFFSNVADEFESTAVAKYDGSENMTGIVLNTNVLSIGSVDDQSITLANLGLYDCDDDEDILYSSNSGTMLVPGCSNAGANIQIETGDTLTLGASETVVAAKLSNAGTITHGADSVIGLAGTGTGSSRPFINSGTVNQATGSFLYNGDGDVEVETSGLTYYKLLLSPTITTARNYTLNGAANIQDDLLIQPTAASALTLTVSLGGTTVVSEGDLVIDKIDSASANLTTTGSNHALTAEGMVIGSGTTFTANGSTVTITGESTLATAYAFLNLGTFTPGTSTVALTSDIGTTVQSMTYNHLSIIPSTGTPTYVLDTGTLATNNLVFGAGDTVTVTAAANSPTINVTGNLTLGDSTTFTKGSGVLNLRPVGTKILTDSNSTKQDLGAISIGSGSATPIIQLGSAVKLTSLTIESAHTLDVNGSNQIEITGNATPLNVTGTFTPSTGTVFYSNATSATVVGTTFNNLTLGNGSGTFTLPGSTLTLRGNLSIASGSSVTKGAGTIDFAAGTTQTWTDNNGTAQDIGTVTVSANGTPTTLNLGSSVKATSLTINTSQTLDVNGANTITLTGNGTVFTPTGTFTASTGTMAFVSAATTGTTIPATTYYNLTLNKVSNTFTAAAGTLNVGNDLTITAGSFDLNTNDPTTTITRHVVIDGTLLAPSATTLTIGGNFDNNGTFTHNDGTLAFNNTGNESVITGTTTFYNISSTTGGKIVKFEAGVTFTIANDLTVTGSVGNLVTIQSDDNGNPWFILLQGTYDISYALIRSSGCDVASNEIDLTAATGITNAGNNGSCWVFSTAQSRGGSGGASIGGGSGGGALLPATFTAGDGTALSTYDSNWNILGGNFAIHTNAVRPNNASDSMALWGAQDYSADQFAELTVTSLASGSYIGVGVRLQDGAHTGYGAYTDLDTNVKIIEWANGSVTTTHYTGSAFAPDDVLRLEILGTTITLKKNGSIVTTVTDATYAAGSPGLTGFGTSTSTRGDNFNAGAVSGGGGGGATGGDDPDDDPSGGGSGGGGSGGGSP